MQILEKTESRTPKPFNEESFDRSLTDRLRATKRRVNHNGSPIK
jgi:hypothetical protein